MFCVTCIYIFTAGLETPIAPKAKELCVL